MLRIRQSRHTTFNRSLGHCIADHSDQARVHWLRNDVLAAERQGDAAVGVTNFLRHRQLGQITQGQGSGDLHFFVDAGRANVQRTTEDKREAQYVVDLVRVVRTTGSHDHVITYFMSQFWFDFRVRVGAGEHDWARRHAFEVFRRQQVGTRQTNEYVSTVQRVSQGALGGFAGEYRLVLVQGVAASVDHAFAVDHKDVLDLGAHADQQLHAGDGGSAGAQTDDLGVWQGLASDFQGVEHTGRGHDSGAVLVIVEHWNVALFDQRAFDFKALRGLDVFQVDAAEGDRDTAYGVDKGLRALGLDFDVEYIDTGKALEQHAFTFHYRLGSQRAKIAETENRGTVGNDCHQIAFAGVAVRQLRITRDFAHRLSDARAVGQGQIACGCGGLG